MYSLGYGPHTLIAVPSLTQPSTLHCTLPYLDITYASRSATTRICQLCYSEPFYLYLCKITLSSVVFCVAGPHKNFGPFKMCWPCRILGQRLQSIWRWLERLYAIISTASYWYRKFRVRHVPYLDDTYAAVVIWGEVFSRVLLNCMKNAVDQLLRQQQVGFRPGRSCVDHLFSLRQIIEKVSEGQKPINSKFCWLPQSFWLHP